MSRPRIRSSWSSLTFPLVGVVAAACSAAGYTQQPGATSPPQVFRPAPTQGPQPPQHQYPVATQVPQQPPNPYPDTTFQNPGVNPPTDVRTDPFSTFAMDVDTASWSVARRFLEDGRLPDPDSVRVEEYINAFPAGYDAPRDATFAIHVDGATSPFTEEGSVLVRVGLQSRTVPDELRKPVSLTFVIDTSGSMGMENRLETVKGALRSLLRGLHANDSVAIVQFGTDASVVLDPTSAAEPESILRAIDSLTPEGSTNAQAGLELGFDIAEETRRDDAGNRVIIASDGVANVGFTDAGSLLERIDREVKSGIDLVSVGVGMGNFNDALLEQLANRGNGFYAYINDQRDADRVFGHGLTSSLETVARDAKVQVEFDPATVHTYRLLGYENRALPDQSFRDPGVDAGEVGSGLTVTALYEVQPWRPGDGHLATVRLRWLDPVTGSEQHLAQDIEAGDLSADYERTDPHFRLVATVAAFGELLRHNPWAERTTLGYVAQQAASLRDAMDGDPDVADFARLTDMAARLVGR
jgi:Ca-activated chloride channel family protein